MHQHDACDSGGHEKKSGSAKRKTLKGGQKERARREGHADSACPVKTFRRLAMFKTTPLDCEAKGNLRVKRRDPWRRANALPKAAADPAPNGQEAKENRRRVLTWFAGRWRNHQPKRAEKPHSKSARRKASDGPATRPITPLAVENGVGKPAAPARVRA